MARTSAETVAKWVAEHHQAVYRYAYRLSGSEVEAEDLTQQAFLIAQERGGQIRDETRAGGWLLAVVRRCFLKTKRRPTPIAASSFDIDLDTMPDGIEEIDIDAEAVQKAIDKLSDDFRIPILMYYFEEKSYREIAEELEIPPGTVMSRLARAKAQLRAKLFRRAMAAGHRETNAENR